MDPKKETIIENPKAPEASAPPAPPAPAIDYAKLAAELAKVMPQPAPTAAPAPAAKDAPRNVPHPALGHQVLVYPPGELDALCGWVTRVTKHDGKEYFDIVAFEPGKSIPRALQSLTEADLLVK